MVVIFLNGRGTRGRQAYLLVVLVGTVRVPDLGLEVTRLVLNKVLYVMTNVSHQRRHRLTECRKARGLTRIPQR